MLVIPHVSMLLLLLLLLMMMILVEAIPCLEFKVLGYNRPGLLKSLLGNLNANLQSSLSLGFFSWAPVHIFIDGPVVGGSDDASKKLIKHSCRVAKAFQRQQHTRSSIKVKVDCRRKNMGTLAQWVNAWPILKAAPFCPAAMILEDDVALTETPGFLSIVSRLVTQLAAGRVDIYGLALQRPQWQLGVSETGRWRRLDLPLNSLLHDDEDGEDGMSVKVFTYPAFVTWGQIVVASHWRSFLEWISKRPANSSSLLPEGLVHKEWLKTSNGHGNSLISPWFMEWALPRGLSNGYIWFGNGTVAASTREDPSGSCHYHHDRLVNEQHILGLQRRLDDLETSSLFRFNHCFDRIIPEWKECFALRAPTPIFDQPVRWIRWLGHHLPRYRWIAQRSIQVVTSFDQISRLFPGYSIRAVNSTECQISIYNTHYYNGTTWIYRRILGDNSIDFTPMISCPYTENLYPHHKHY